MSFSRSKAGISNYSEFFGVDYVFFIEGKTSSLKKTPDEDYYETLFRLVLPGKKIKVKPVGNKADALVYFSKIDKTKNDFVCIDKDLEGITTSIIEHQSLIYTKGYSWENDLWTTPLVKETLKSLNIEQDEKAIRKLFIVQSRIFKICCLDAGCQANGHALFKKNDSKIGIQLDFRKKFTPSKSEFRRISDSYKLNKGDCSIPNEIAKAAFSKESHQVIQGHLWEKICQHIICEAYKEYHSARSAPTDMIKTIAISNFKRSPQQYINPDLIEYIKLKIANQEQPKKTKSHIPIHNRIRNFHHDPA